MPPRENHLQTIRGCTVEGLPIRRQLEMEKECRQERQIALWGLVVTEMNGN